MDEKAKEAIQSTIDSFSACAELDKNGRGKKAVYSDCTQINYIHTGGDGYRKYPGLLPLCAAFESCRECPKHQHYHGCLRSGLYRFLKHWRRQHQRQYEGSAPIHAECPECVELLNAEIECLNALLTADENEDETISAGALLAGLVGLTIGLMA